MNLPPSDVGQHAVWKDAACPCARECPRRPDVCRTLANEGEVHVGDRGVVLQLTNVDGLLQGVRPLLFRPRGGDWTGACRRRTGVQIGVMTPAAKQAASHPTPAFRR